MFLPSQEIHKILKSTLGFLEVVDVLFSTLFIVVMSSQAYAYEKTPGDGSKNLNYFSVKCNAQIL